MGLGKKSEFFLELDETDGGGKAESAAQSAAAEAQPADPKPAVAKADSAAKAKPAAAKADPKPAMVPVPPVPEITSFAADYVGGPSMPRRRRPGPSLSPFKDMAKQMPSR
ncbi:hypothetical protein E1H13_10275 [Nodosilinea sp. P-1105]|nr:hypothetical protein [Nodosilinea sp. P-1105]